MTQDNDKNYGWVPDHRNICEWEWYTDVSTCHLYRHIKLSANWKPTKWRGITIERGQYKSSIRDLAHETGLSIQNIRTALINLTEKTHYIKTSPSGANDSIFTVVNYEKEVDIPKKQLTDSITHSEQENNQEKSAACDDDSVNHHTPDNTPPDTLGNTQSNIEDNTLPHTLDNTPNSTVVTHESHTIFNNIKNIYNPKREGGEHSPPDLENLDLKKEKSKWYDYFKSRHPGAGDDQINISYGNFLAKNPKKQWVWPVWQKWVNMEKLELNPSNPSKKQEIYKFDETHEATLDKVLQQVRTELKRMHGDAIFQNWLQHIALERREGGVCYLTVPSKLMKLRIENHYFQKVILIWKKLEPDIKSFEFHVKKAKENINATG